MKIKKLLMRKRNKMNEKGIIKGEPVVFTKPMQLSRPRGKYSNKPRSYASLVKLILNSKSTTSNKNLCFFKKASLIRAVKDKKFKKKKILSVSCN